MDMILESGNRLKLIITILILVAIVIVYLIFSQKFASQQSKVVNNGGISVSQIQPTITPTPSIAITPTPLLNKQDAQSGVAKGGQSLSNGEVSSLPKTGFPATLMGVFSASAIVAGWFLRKYPN